MFIQISCDFVHVEFVCYHRNDVPNTNFSVCVGHDFIFLVNSGLFKIEILLMFTFLT